MFFLLQEGRAKYFSPNATAGNSYFLDEIENL